MNPFTPAELNTLCARLIAAAAGIERELADRRHPLSGRLPRDQRHTLADLLALRQRYSQLATLADALSRRQSLPADHPAAGGLLAFAADELALLRATQLYVATQPFAWQTQRRLLRQLDLESRFFTLIVAHFQGDLVH
jgi:hypothetical protein